MIDINALLKEATIIDARSTQGTNYILGDKVYAFNRVLADEEIKALNEYLIENLKSSTTQGAMMTECKCGNPLIVRTNVYYYDSRWFSSLYCPRCEHNYDNPDDSMQEYVNQTKALREDK